MFLKFKYGINCKTNHCLIQILSSFVPLITNYFTKRLDHFKYYAIMKKRQITILIIPFICGFLNSQNFWIPTNGPNGLVIQDLAIATNQSIYISAKNSGIYVTQDQGLSWNNLDSGLTHSHSFATHLAVYGEDKLYGLFENDLWILEIQSGIWRRLSFNANYSDLYTGQDGSVYVRTWSPETKYLISKDNGVSFQVLLESRQLANIATVSLNGLNRNYFAEREGPFHNIYKVNDDGSNLMQIYRGSLLSIKLYTHSSGYLFITDPYNGMTRIDSQGKNRISYNTSLGPVRSLLLKPDGTILCLTDNADYFSLDTGRTWLKHPTTFFNKVLIGDRVFINDSVVYIINNGCYDNHLIKSSDGGNSWQSFHNQFSNESIFNHFVTKSNVLYAERCTDFYEYAFSVNQGISWHPYVYTVNGISFRDLQVMDNGNMFLLIERGIIFSNDEGRSWNNLKINNDNYFNHIVSDQKNVIMVDYSGKNYISRNGGNDWDLVIDAPPSYSKIRIHPDGDYYCLSGYPNLRTIYKSEDFGIHWKKTSLTELPIIDFHLAKNGMIYFSMNNPSFFQNGLYLLDNKLLNYQFINPATFTSIVDDPEGTLYGTVLNGSCKFSKDNGNTWINFDLGLPVNNQSIRLVIDDKNYLYLSSYNDVIYKTIEPVSNVTDSKSSDNLKRIQIYPNPGNAMIQVEVKDNILQNNSRWCISNSMGNIIRTGLLSKQKIQIDVSNIPAGLYYFQIHGAASAIEKLIIAK